MQDLLPIAASVLTLLALASLSAGWLGPRARLWVCRAGQITAGGLVALGWWLFFSHGGTSGNLMVLMGMAAAIVGAAALLALSLIGTRLADPEAPSPPP